MSQTRFDLQTTDVLMFVHDTLVSLQPLISDPRNLQFFSLVGDVTSS